MAILTTTQTLEEGPRNLILHLTGRSDGSGSEDSVLKVDVSELKPKCGSVRINRITGSVTYGIVELYWDALDPKKFAVLSGESINLDFCLEGGLTNNAVGKTGDVLLSTVGFELNSTYDLNIEMVKKQESIGRGLPSS
jgi:hypothetical protein